VTTLPPAANGLTYYPVTLARWTFEVTVIRTADNLVYLPITAICQRLGIAEYRQIQKLRDDPEYAPYLQQMPVPTSKGNRDTWCIRRQAVGGWLNSIQSNRVRAEIAPRLAEFRMDVMSAADRCLFGELVQQEPTNERELVETTNSLIRHALFMEDRVGDIEEDVGMLKSSLNIADSLDEDSGAGTYEVDIPLAGGKGRVRLTLAVIRAELLP
jgi:hypothetical protein